MMVEKILGMPVNASAHGAAIDRLMLYIHIVMAVLFVGWFVFFLFVLFRFRQRKHPKADYHGAQTHASSYLEGVIAAVEIVLLAGFSIPLWANKVSAFPPHDEATHIRVIAQQFAWNVHYPGPDGIFGRSNIQLVDEVTNPIGLDRSDPHAKDDVWLLNELYLPVNKPVIVDLTSKDVIHSFALPNFRVKQDVIPGMSIPVYFTPTKTTELIREQLARTVKLSRGESLEGYVAMKDYKDKEGEAIVKKGRSISEEAIDKLIQNEIQEISIGPRTPTEIACAQLCGLNHYRMRGYVYVLTQEEFDEWFEEELEYLEDEEE